MKTAIQRLLATAILAYCQFITWPTLAQSTIFYGMTSNGGATGGGTIFKFDPGTKKETAIWTFGSGTDGWFPQGNLTLNPVNHLFYGMTYQGGANNIGAIFSFDPTSNIEKVVYSFGGAGNDGAPTGSLVFDTANGLFYGAAERGYYDKGVIFSFNPNTNQDSILWSFRGGATDGQAMKGDFVYCPLNHLFYGMTSIGGKDTGGTIISFNPITDSEKVVWSFGKGLDGRMPWGDLTFDNHDSLFYGMTNSGGAYQAGVIFSFNPEGDSEKVLWNLGSGFDGASPSGGFAYDPTANILFGTTTNGGLDSIGAVISFNLSNDNENLVYNFNYKQIWSLVNSGDLIYYADSNILYGMTYSGGKYDFGSIYSLNPNNDSVNILWSFNDTTDGSLPYGSLTPYQIPTGIDQPSFSQYENQLSVYPNPNNGVFTLEIQNLSQAVQLQVFNVLGKKVFNTSLNTHITQLNLSNQPAGIYLFRALDESGNLLAKGKVFIE